MVQLTRPEINRRRGPPTAFPGGYSPMNFDIEDSLYEEHGPLSKRLKSSSLPFDQSWSNGNNKVPIPPSQYNPLDEPSPLGLRLRKSPSLLDLIQMRLSSQGKASIVATQSEDLTRGNKKGSRDAAASGTLDKLKASNFHASVLKIGQWEYVARHEGGLVVKCYFAKHKLVWEVLNGGLKNKIEIQWSDIMALKANCPDNGPGSLTVVLARQPIFFRETSPQPRKHTLWKATEDFTDGQASRHRQHLLQCPQGVLNKHYEKLIQCDSRLNFLSRQQEIVLDSLYFEAQTCAVKDTDESRCHDLDQREPAKGSTISSFQDLAPSQLLTQSSHSSIGQSGPICISPQLLCKGACSPSSAVDALAIEGNANCEGYEFQGPNLERPKMPELHQSMSTIDLVNHIGNCISEQMNSRNLSCAEKASDCQHMLENIAQILLSDTQMMTISDEKSLMSRVNSFCCLLQDPNTVDRESHIDGPGGRNVEPGHANGLMNGNNARSGTMVWEEDPKDVPCSKQATTMSRKDSFGELLVSLPRIASLPKFLFDISEDGEN